MELLSGNVAELEAAIQAQMPLRTEMIDIAGKSFALRLPRDIDAIYDALIARGEDDPAFQDQQIPYWADLWPSAIALGRFLAERQIPLAGRQVLEIGCGLGLSGLVAQALGGEVIQTDYLPDALRLAHLNGVLNLESPPRYQLLDWRKPDLSLRSPILLAADLAYEERAFEPLASCFDALLEPGGSIYLSEPGRAIARNFPDFLQARGFQLSRYEWPVFYRNMHTQVSVYHLNRT